MTAVEQYQPIELDRAYRVGRSALLAEMKPVAVWRINTEDCVGGAVIGLDTATSLVCRRPYLSPVVGRFYVDGAALGARLMAHFDAVALDKSYLHARRPFGGGHQRLRQLAAVTTA
jgi:hypothetical protein